MRGRTAGTRVEADGESRVDPVSARIGAGSHYSVLSRANIPGGIAPLLLLALLKLSVHLVTNAFGGYGYVRDELYYLACSDHMAWGYVDHPPLSVAVLWVSRLLFGDSLFALRFLPAASGATVVFLTGLLTRELGGGRYAQILAALCVIAAPLLLGMDSIFSMNSYEILLWTVAFYLIVLVLKREERKYWLFLGVALGLGLLNKISVLWLGAGLAVGLLLTSRRKMLLTPGPWIAAGVALLLFLPHIIWQVLNGYPTLEFIRNAGSGKYAALSPVEMFLQQALFMNPLTLPIWLSGLIYFLTSKPGRPWRILPLIYLVVFLILAITKYVKAVYLGPLFPMLFATGAISVEQFVLALHWRWIKPAILVLVLGAGIALAPFVIAVLPVETYISYAQALGVAPATAEKNELGRLPQHFADMFGWEKMVESVAQAYESLSPDEKTKCAILCNNYGEAGAIDFFGRRYRLPGSICGHNNYWLWGPGDATGEVVIRLGGSPEAFRAAYAEVTQAGLFKDEYCMPYEN
ncbi:phospholipid carrier-dependent glycosyltransferase, partial [bacterium]